MIDHFSTGTAAQDQGNTLFVSLELSKARWMVTTSAPGSRKLSRHSVVGGDGDALVTLIAGLQGSAAKRCGAPVPVAVIQEAGLDGFWIHRLLICHGIESHLVDPASIAVSRRHRRAKTDAIDGEALLRTLMAWSRGERQVCAMVQPPSPEVLIPMDAAPFLGGEGVSSAGLGLLPFGVSEGSNGCRRRG